MLKNLFLSIITIFLAGCCAGARHNEQQEINIHLNKINSWLNLMPGGSPSFHIAGEVMISNNSGTEITKLGLEKILVYQNNKKLYTITPFFNPSDRNAETGLKPAETKLYIFGTRSGMQIKPELDKSTFISAELKFSAGENSIIAAVDSIIIEEAY